MGYETAFITDPTTKEVATVRGHGLDTNLQDQTSRPVLNHFSRVMAGPVSLYADWAQDSYVMQLPLGHGLLAGDSIFIYNGLYGMELLIITVSADMGGYNDVTVDTLASVTFEVAGDYASAIYQVSHDLNVNGSMTPVVFRYPVAEVGDIPASIDVTNVNLTMTDTSAMDDSLFGSLAALTKGVIFRHHRSDGIHHIGTFRSNAAFAIAGNAEYPDKVPAGVYAFRAKFKIAGQQNVGVALRIEAGDYLEVIIQDDISALDFFHAVVIGHIVTD